MASPRFAWGIDVGNRALKAVKLVRDGDNLRVDDYEVIEHETILSNAGDNRETLIQTALANFVQRHPGKGGIAAVGVSGQASFARFIKLPPVEPKKIPEIVRFEAIQQIPFPLDDVEWSYQLFQSPESPDVEVGIFAMRKELINQHIAHFTSVDLNVQVVQMNPLAVYNAMQYDQRIDGTTMIIDLGAENTDLIIADEHSIWLRSIPIGGNNFTEALVKSFKLNFPKAEELKRNAATSKYARQIFQAMRPVFADLVAEVQRSIGFYASVHRDSRIKRILALGGTFRLPGLQKYLQQNLQLEVHRLDSLGAMPPSDPKMAAGLNDSILSVVSAYGLALQGMGEGKITSSLLPQHIRRAKIWKEKQKWFAAAAALFVVGTGVGYASFAHGKMSYNSAHEVRSKNERLLDEATILDSKWSTIANSGSADRQRILNIHGLENYRDLWPMLVRDVYDSVPTLDVTSQEIKQKYPDRGSRKQIFIDYVLSKFMPDLSAPMSADHLGQFAQTPANTNVGGGFGTMGNRGFAPAPTPSAMPSRNVPSAARRGFVLTIYGTTPNREGVRLVEKTLLTKLREITQNRAIKEGKPYYIAKAQVVSRMQIINDKNKLAALKNAYDNAMRARNAGTFVGAGGGMGGGPVPAPDMGQGGGGQVAGNDTKAYEDRLTGEDVRNDWEFTVVAVVALDPQPNHAAGAR